MQAAPQVPGSFHPVAIDPLSELRRELMNWAEPVIADRILEGYRNVDPDLARTRLLAGQHRRLWRAILLEKRSIMDSLREELQHDLLEAGLGQEIAEAIDQSVIEELIDIVLKRFRASGERVKGFSMILLGAASHISPSKSIAYS